MIFFPHQYTLKVCLSLFVSKEIEYNIVIGFIASDGPYYAPIITDYILQFVDPPSNQPPGDPAIPGFNLNMTILMIFCTSALLIIRRRKTSKN